jgi:HPt (histidine-containing phosphotransfer) domain-containing protein
MVIYNNNKEFIGIDEENLKSLGYSNLASLLSESADLADLFVKVQGHVHNFKNVHWIDFILCATDKDSSKTILHANSKSYSCTLDIKTIYLSASPMDKSFSISLNNLRALSSTELQNISGDLQARPTPVGAGVVQEQPQTAPAEFDDVTLEHNTPAEIDAYDIDEFDIEDSAVDAPVIQETNDEKDPYEEDKFNLDIYEPSADELEKIDPADTGTTQMTRESLYDNLEDHINIDDDLEEDEPSTQTLTQEKNDDEEDYVFDIQKTADALEMDVATIEDFINDFVMQAKEFKPKLYEAVDNDDMTELKSLSHQLKGVAANLRIHDAQEILVDINNAEDFTNSKTDLDKFYNIMSKLAEEEKEDAFDIAEIDEDVKEDDTLEIPEIPEIPDDVPEDDAFDIAEIDEDALEIVDDFDLLEDEQDFVKPTQPYDKNDVANQIGLDQDSFNELFEDYSNDSKALVKEIQDAIDADDTNKWQSAAVKLKGMSDNMRVESFKSELEGLIDTQDRLEAKNTLEEINKILLSIIDKKD